VSPRTADEAPCGDRWNVFTLSLREKERFIANLFTGDIHKATTWSIVLSVPMVAAGVLAMFSPAIAGVAVTVFFGWLLIVP
jgi:uncharacterized membrane protein HdeD (DUF308 family)